MALPDLTDQNIQDTYQRVLQTDNGILRDGTGSLVTLTNITASGTSSFDSIEVNGDILPTTANIHSIGSPTKPFKSLHVLSESIHFHNASGTEIAKISVDESADEIQFINGNGFQRVRVGELNFGDTFENTGSVQIEGSGTGRIAINGTPGKFATVYRGELQSLGGDYQMGSIAQKGSGSFAMLIDADGTMQDSKFVIEKNAAIPNVGTRLFSVSESMETRAYGHLKVDDYITTTNITASGNISASGQLIGMIDGGSF